MHMFRRLISRFMVVIIAVSCISPDAVHAVASSGQATLDDRSGRVIDGVYTGGDHLIVYVQDVHCNGGVQRNINSIIQSFARAGNLRTVFVEGAPAGSVEQNLLARYPDGPAKTEALERMLDAGLLSGAEYGAAINSGYAVRGIEDGPLYNDNMLRLQRLMRAQRANSAVARRTAHAIRAATRRHLSRDIARLQRQYAPGVGAKQMQRFTAAISRQAAEAGEDLGRYPEFQRYMRLQACAQDIRQAGTAAQRAEQFAEIQSLRASFNPQAFYFEQRELFAALLASRARLPHEQDVLMLARLGGIFSAMVDLKATVKDVEFFARHERDFYLLLARYCGFDAQRAALGILRDQELMRYYTLNVQRDEHFAKAVLGDVPPVVGASVPPGPAVDVLTRIADFRTVDVVVAGGFHDGLVRRLRLAGVSFVTIMPVVPSVNPASEAVYRQTIAGGLDIQQVVAAATAPRPGDAALVEQDAFTEKFFAELLILIQSEKHCFALKHSRPGMSRKKRNALAVDVPAAIESSINSWRERVSEGDQSHPLARLAVHYDAPADEWVISFEGAEMLRARMSDDGTEITSVKKFFRAGEDAPPAAAEARQQWDISVARLAQSLGITVADLAPAFIIRDSGAIDGFAVARRQRRAGPAQTIEAYMASLSMDGMRRHVAAGGRVEFIMGHNNPDNDALFSALIKAYLFTQYAGEEGTLYVPLMCVIDPAGTLTDEQGLATVTTEVELSCRELGLDLSTMIQSRHVARWLAELSDETVRAQLGLTLVDVHDLPDDAGLERIPRTGTDDHHPNYPAEETTDLQDGEQVHKVGATLSVIARWARSLGIPLTEGTMDMMVRMMVSGILDDTKGLRSEITQLVDVFNTYWYAQVAGVAPEEMFRRQNTIHEPPTADQVVADRKDSYHKSVLIAHHMVRRVEGSDDGPFAVEQAMRDEIFAKMEALRAAGSSSRPFYNAFILMLTCMETGESRLWIATNDMVRPEEDPYDDGKRTTDALAALLNLLRKTYPDARLSDVLPGADGTRRYEIRGLYGLTTRKEIVPLIKRDRKKKSILDTYWPEQMVEAADEIIAKESPRFLELLFGPQSAVRRMEIVVGTSLDDDALSLRQRMLNSWHIAPGEHLSSGQPYTVSVDVPLGGGRGTARVALVADADSRRISYWIRETPAGFDIGEHRTYMRSEAFGYRVAVAFAMAMNGNDRAVDYTGQKQPMEIRYSVNFTPPHDVFPFPARPLEIFSVEQSPSLDMELIARMNAAA